MSGESWFSALRGVFASEWWENTVTSLLRMTAKGQSVYPSSKVTDLCRALYDVKPDDVRVVILGQDPYVGHYKTWDKWTPKATGRAFAVPASVQHWDMPASLKNIFKEVSTDIGSIPKNGSLDGWVAQGVLLLNSHLSVGDEALSHAHLNWKELTGAMLRHLDEREKPVVFLVWGREAQRFIEANVKNKRHILIYSAHPSPLSASKGFFGSRPFSQANVALQALSQPIINWSK